MKTLIVYYSYLGNTKSIAEMIQKKTGAEVKSGMNIKFDEATLRTSVKDIENWIDKIS